MDDDEAAALQKKMAVAENLQRQSKLPLGAVEILTPKDFERLEILQKHEAAAMGKRQRRTEIGAVVDPTELEPSTKQKRRRIEERIALIKANQDEVSITFLSCALVCLLTD
uniref:SDA1 middle domain-containing protein n=1 Tax=Spongospora subterranea TaxID=70186 RepID=A0A0H5QSN5_9EUKA|eukprot:CRZ04589.1 hypothetical protein [Spongospora subterranea]